MVRLLLIFHSEQIVNVSKPYVRDAETTNGTIMNVTNTLSVFDLFETRNVAVVKLLLVLCFATLLW